MRFLTVLHDDNGSFVDLSQKLFDYGRDTSSISIVASEDKLYLGFEKAFNDPYFEFVSTDFAGNVTYEYSLASTFNSLSVVDNTSAQSRSGFTLFSRPSDWEKQVIDGKELYWVRLTYDADHTTEYAGINKVFSDDSDLSEEYRSINDYICQGDTTFIMTHQAAKKDIIQRLRNSGNYKKPEDETAIIDIDEWDLLDQDQVKQASKMLTLSKIFENASDSIDGKFEQLSMKYQKKYENAIDLFLLTLDVNDSGDVDKADEFNPFNQGMVKRL